MPRVLVWAETAANAGLARRALAGTPALSSVVGTDGEFLRALHSGVWDTYVILDTRKPLTAHFDAELAERVFSGATLIGSRWANMDDLKQTDVFGVRYEGQLPPATRTIALAETTVTPKATLTATGKMQRLSASTAKTLATADGRPAVTLNRYGSGSALLYAFDLASATGADPAAVLAAAIRGAAPSVRHADALGVAAIAVRVTNRGVPLRLHVREALAGARPLAALGATPAADGSLSWTADLARGETATFRYLVRLPEAGPLTATTEVTYDLGGQTRAYGTYPLTLAPERDASALLAAALQRVQAVPAATQQDRQRRTRAADTLRRLQGSPPTTKDAHAAAIADLVRATSDLEAMEADVTDARLATDHVLAYYEARWSL